MSKTTIDPTRKFQFPASVIRETLRDYERSDPGEDRRRLIEIWRAAFPDAAKEESPVNKPLLRSGDYHKTHSDLPDEEWFNDTYTVTVRRHAKDLVFGTDGGMVQLGICALDGTARHDWREFQAIKNQIAGPECEGFELYPAESRLLDPSNYYTVWCFPGVRRLKVGLNERRVLDSDEALAPQRKLPRKGDEGKHDAERRSD